MWNKALLVLSLAGCASAGPAPTLAQVIGATVASRASGGCYSHCAGGTECDAETGLCRPIRTQVASASSVPPPAGPPPIEARHFPDYESSGAYRCTSEAGFDDDVIADSADSAVLVCQELNDGRCTCAPSS